MVSYLTIARCCRHLIPDCLLGALLDTAWQLIHTASNLSPPVLPPVTRNTQETHPGFLEEFRQSAFAAGRIRASVEAETKPSLSDRVLLHLRPTSCQRREPHPVASCGQRVRRLMLISRHQASEEVVCAVQTADSRIPPRPASVKRAAPPCCLAAVRAVATTPVLALDSAVNAARR